jgi:hypothetical protein
MLSDAPNFPQGAWLLRAGGRTGLLDEFVLHGAAALDVPPVADPTALASAHDFEACLAEARPTYAADHRRRLSQKLWRFMHMVEPGDFVVADDQPGGRLMLGRFTSGFGFDPEPFGDDYPYVRHVQWVCDFLPDQFAPWVQHEMARVTALGDLQPYLGEVHALLAGRWWAIHSGLESLVQGQTFRGASFTLAAAEPPRLLFTRLGGDHINTAGSPWPFMWLAACLCGLWASRHDPNGWFMVLSVMAALGLLSIPGVWVQAFRRAPPQPLVFDVVNRKILDGEREVAGFDDVQHLEVMTRSHPVRPKGRPAHHGYTHFLRLVLKDGRLLRLAWERDYHALERAARPLAHVLGTDFIRAEAD